MALSLVPGNTYVAELPTDLARSVGAKRARVRLGHVEGERAWVIVSDRGIDPVAAWIPTAAIVASNDS